MADLATGFSKILEKIKILDALAFIFSDLGC